LGISPLTLPRVTAEAGRFELASDRPVAELRCGDLVVVETEDCFSGQVVSPDQTFASDDEILALVGSFNPVTGPIEIPEARVGDTLAVTVHAIELAPRTARAVTVVTADMDTVCGHPMSGPRPHAHTSVARIEGEELMVGLPGRGALRLPTRPMIGTIGVAPTTGAQSSLVFSAQCGGNLDCAVLGPGSTLYLPVNVDGAHLSLGDVHAAMGDAEVTSTAYETSADVTLSVQVHPRGAVAGPDPGAQHALWLDTPELMGAVGCEFGAPLEANFAHAFEALCARLCAAYDVSTAEVWGLVGATASARPNQCVHGGWTSTYVGVPHSLIDQLPSKTAGPRRER
jgi:amidase